MKRYYFLFMLILMFIGCTVLAPTSFVNGQSASDNIEVNGADTNLVLGLEVSVPSGWQSHPIILSTSRGDAAWNYAIDNSIVQDFFDIIGQSNSVVADVMVQHADLTRRYNFGVHPISELSAPVPQMQIMVSRSDSVRHNTLSRPTILGDVPLIPTATATDSPTPAATDVPATEAPLPTDTSTPTPPPSATQTEIQDQSTATPAPSTATPTSSNGDSYETDDSCTQAQVLPANGDRQNRTFHQEDDADWIQMELQANTTYELSAISTSPRADLIIELYLTCGDSVPESSDSPALGAGAQVEFTPISNGTYYAKILNQEPDVYGSDVTYGLELKELAPQGDVAIIVTGHDDGYNLQANIFHAANTAYRTFRNSGIPKARIRYLGLLNDDRGDADHDEVSDVDTEATTANIQEVITNWAVDQVNSDSRIYLYMIDHGLVDEMMIDGNEDILTPEALDQWLGLLEAETGADIAVIYEACLSGSFITGIENISRSGRVVITSTGDDANAYPRQFGGAQFSDSFFPALNRGESLYEAYLQGKNSSVVTKQNQIPMLDDNGDRRSNRDDGDLARQWVLNNNAALSGEAGAVLPVLATPQAPEKISDGEGTIRVAITHSEQVGRVWIEVQRPSDIEPAPATDGIMPERNLPVVELSDSDQDGTYIGIYEGFVEEGVYTFIAYAEDEQGYLLTPSSLEIEVDVDELDGASDALSERIYLPLISR